MKNRKFVISGVFLAISMLLAISLLSPRVVANPANVDVGDMETMASDNPPTADADCPRDPIQVDIIPFETATIYVDWYAEDTSNWWVLGSVHSFRLNVTSEPGGVKKNDSVDKELHGGQSDSGQLSVTYYNVNPGTDFEVLIECKVLDKDLQQYDSDSDDCTVETY